MIKKCSPNFNINFSKVENSFKTQPNLFSSANPTTFLAFIAPSSKKQDLIERRNTTQTFSFISYREKFETFPNVATLALKDKVKAWITGDSLGVKLAALEIK